MKRTQLYTQGDLNRIFEHHPSRTLLFWASSGLVQWADEKVDGRGRHRLYGIQGLYQFGLIEELACSELNLDLEHIKGLMRGFHSPHSYIWWEQPYTLVMGKNNPTTKPEEYREQREDGSKIMIAWKAPGWSSAVVVPGDDWQDNELVKMNLPDAYITIAIHLKVIVEKVHCYIDRAKE